MRVINVQSKVSLSEKVLGKCSASVDIYCVECPISKFETS